MFANKFLNVCIHTQAIRKLFRKEFTINLKRIQNHVRHASLIPQVVSESEADSFVKEIIQNYSNNVPLTEFKEFFRNTEIVSLLDTRQKIQNDISHLKEMIKNDDKEIADLAREEESVFIKEIKRIDEMILTVIYESLGTTEINDIILEITAGVGGQEAMLFAKELFDMYIKHVNKISFTSNIIEIEHSDQGGIRFGSMTISGIGCFQMLRHEGGVHRVQRVPATEKSGRIHTSVVSVAVLPQPTEIQINLRHQDLRIDTYRSSGPGGQNVNKTDSAVRIVHLPTGLTTDCQVSRSQIENKELAYSKLRALIYKQHLDSQTSRTSQLRKKQMGLGLRNEKIRTYNFPQDRITDHRLKDGSIHNLDEFMEGGKLLTKFHVMLQDDLRKKLLLETMNRI